MNRFIWLFAFLTPVLLLTPTHAHAFDIEAGPIWHNNDAKGKCPGTCQSAGAKWNGQWTTTIWNKMSVCGCESDRPPLCSVATLRDAGGSRSKDAQAKAHCDAKGNKWHSYTDGAPGYIQVACCAKAPSNTTGISSEFRRMSNDLNADERLKSRFASATTDQSVVTLANQLGYRITVQDITAARGSLYYRDRMRLHKRSEVDPGCGGLRQHPCSSCTNAQTFYVPLGFCCLPVSTACASYKITCDNGFSKNKFGECWPQSWRKRDIGQWAINFDRQWHLPMEWQKLNHVTELRRNMGSLPPDGLYIFVYRTTDNKLLVRRSDRPDDKGCYSEGDKRYSYSGNPEGNGETPHMFVRHTQLNGGWKPVWSAGQLEIWNGKIIWVSNQSGHFHPSMMSLDYVVNTLEAWNLVVKDSVHRFDFGQEHRTAEHCRAARTGVPGLNTNQN